MQINRTRPVLAFLLVAVVCGFVIAEGLRASALTIVIGGRAPVSFGALSVPGAVLGPVLSLRKDEAATQVIPVAGNAAPDQTARPVVADAAASGTQHNAVAVAVVHHTAGTTGGSPATPSTPVAKPVVPTTPSTPSTPSNPSNPTVTPPTSGETSGHSNHHGTSGTPTVVGKPTTSDGSGTGSSPSSDHSRGDHGRHHGHSNQHCDTPARGNDGHENQGNGSNQNNWSQSGDHAQSGNSRGESRHQTRSDNGGRHGHRSHGRG